MEAAPILILLVMVAVVALSFWWTFSRSDDILRRWERRRGCRIIARRYCTLWRGPYMFVSSNSHAVWRVTVRTEDGRIRHAWLRLGGWFSGLFADTVDETWID